MIKEIHLPLVGRLGKKNYWFTLNNYRNWHFQVSNNLKKKFKKGLEGQLNFRYEGKVQIRYEYYTPNNSKRDLMNTISVIDKFFQDALVENKCIESDDLFTVPRVHAEYIKLDKENPRLVAFIERYVPREENIELDLFGN